MLSQTAEYALRAMVTLAHDEETPLTAQEIANLARIPLDYLSKVLNLLARAGLVKAQRGRCGGFHIAKPADRMTVLEIVNAVDPLRRIRSCPLGLSAHGSRLCPLHRKLDEAVRSVEEAFAATTIASLVGEPATEQTFCGDHGHAALVAL